jgi:hypothetical protein
VKRIYLAGPMTGIVDFNYPAFHAEAARLRQLGYHVENPAENPAPACGSWAGYMRLALAQLLACDTAAFLPGWGSSRGAGIEHALAVDLGLRITLAHQITDPTFSTTTEGARHDQIQPVL